MKKAVLVLTLIIACVFVFAACDTKDDVTYYQETVVGKYGDGISMVGIVTPDTAPTYYTDVPRVEKSIYFDTRLEGWHFTGVYVVKGEKITLTVPEDKADGSITATVGRYSSAAYTVAINSSTFSFVPTVSGLLDVNLGNCYGDDFWNMTVSGGIAASYYRLGLDRVAEWENSIGYAVVDAANIRLYLPSEYLYASTDIEEAATWWRSLCEYVDKYLIGDFAADKLTTTDVFVTASVSAPYYDVKKDALYVPVSYADKIIDSDALTRGQIWQIVLAFSKGKTAYAGATGSSSAAVAEIVAAGAFVTLTDSVLDEESSSEYWINNAYDCLRLSLTGDLNAYGDLAAYVNLIHSFGEEKVVGTAVSYLFPEEGSDLSGVTLAQYFCDSFAGDDIDLSPYFEAVFGIETAAAEGELTPYVPVQSVFATGVAAAQDKTGITVNSGENTTFDFRNAVISTASSVNLKKVLIGDKEWLPDEDGLYRYKPSDDVISQDITLEYEADGQTVVLRGRLTCNIAVSVFTRYENVPWRDMKSAVKEYSEKGDAYLADERAVFKAEIPQNEEVDDGVYTFSVNKGVIQVEETATYVIYVRSKGMTRVDFGVPEYMFTMFENTLTVSEYTDLLCYEIELQEGVSYYYDVYILATKGNAYACLGIEKKGEGVIRDIDDSYLVYYPFDREDIAEYDAPAITPENFGVSREDRKHYEDLGAMLTEYPAAEKGSDVAAATDGNEDTSFTSKEALSHTYVFEFEEIVETDYILIKTGLSGVEYTLSYSLDGENYVECGSGTVYRNIDKDFCKSVGVKYVKLTFTSSQPFNSVIKDIYCGVYDKLATIVPSNSSRVLYQGKWQYKTGGISVNGWILESYGDDAAIEFNFYGSALSVYCAKGEVYGSMQIYVDGKQYGAVELNNPTTLYNCNVFSIDFASPGKHRIRLVPSSNDDIINLDYFTVVYAEQEEASPEVGNLWYFAIIPAALLAVFAVCAVLDIIDRHNNRRKLAVKSGKNSSDATESDEEDGKNADEK